MKITTTAIQNSLHKVQGHIERFNKYLPRESFQKNFTEFIAKAKETRSPSICLLLADGGVGKTRTLKEITQDPSLKDCISIPPFSVHNNRSLNIIRIFDYIAHHLIAHQNVSKARKEKLHLFQQELISSVKDLAHNEISELKGDIAKYFETYFQEICKDFVDGEKKQLIICLDTIEQAYQLDRFIWVIKALLEALPQVILVLAGRPLKGTPSLEEPLEQGGASEKAQLTQGYELTMQKLLDDSMVANIYLETLRLQPFTPQESFKYLTQASDFSEAFKFTHSPDNLKQMYQMGNEIGDDVIKLCKGEPLRLSFTLFYLTLYNKLEDIDALQEFNRLEKEAKEALWTALPNTDTDNHTDTDNYTLFQDYCDDYFQELFRFKGDSSTKEENDIIGSTMAQIIKLTSMVRQPITLDLWNNFIANFSDSYRNNNKDFLKWANGNRAWLLDEVVQEDYHHYFDSEVSQDCWNFLKILPWIRFEDSDESFTLHDSIAEEIYRSHTSFTKEKQSIWEQFRDFHKHNSESMQLYYEILLDPSKGISSLTESLSKASNNNKYSKMKELSSIFDSFLLDFIEKTYVFSQGTQSQHRHSLKTINLTHDVSSSIEIQDIHKDAIEEIWNLLQSDVNTRFDVIKTLVEFHKIFRYHSKANQLATGLIEDIGITSVQDNEVNENNLETIRRLCYLYNERGKARSKLPTYFDEAQEDFITALELSQQDRGIQKHDIYKSLADANVARGRINRSLQYYQKAMKQMSYPQETENDLRQQCRIHIDYALALGLKADFLNAYSIIEMAIRQAYALEKSARKKNPEDDKYSLLLGRAKLFKGEIYRYSHNFSIAWESYEAAEEYFNKVGARNFLPNTFFRMSLCLYQAIRDWEIRRNSRDLDFFESVRIEENAKGTLYIPSLAEDSSRYIQFMRDKAIHYAEQAIQYAKRYNINNLTKIYAKVGPVFYFKGKGDFSRAIKVLELGIAHGKEKDDYKYVAENRLVKMETQLWHNLHYQGGYITKKGEKETFLKTIYEELDLLMDEVEQANVEDYEGRILLLKGSILLESAMQQRDLEDTWRAAIQHYVQALPLILPTYAGNSGMGGMPKQYTTFISTLNHIKDYDQALYMKIYKYVVREWSDIEWASQYLSGPLLSLLQSPELKLAD